MEAGGVGAVHLLTGRLLMGETVTTSKVIALQRFASVPPFAVTTNEIRFHDSGPPI